MSSRSPATPVFRRGSLPTLPRPALALAAVLALGGCSDVPTRDPAFAAVRPVAAPPPAPTGGAIYRPGFNLVLFEDTRARQVGDILTIELVESTDAKKSADTSLDKTTDVNVTNPTLLGTTPRFDLPGGLPLASRRNLDLSASLDSTSSFKGESESTQSNSLKGRISVTVAEVLPNGNLVVRGEKIITLNQGNEHVRISGIVRPVDIAPDNTIPSTRVADARIIYAGEGAPAEVNAIGWLARFFVSALFPF